MLFATPSPIHNLPPELISIIIQGGIRQDTITLPPASAANDVVRLSQICRRWRDIAHGQRSLWRKYDIDLPRDWTQQQFRSLLASLAQFVSHAGPEDLHFSIRHGPVNVARDALMQILLAHSGRMTSLGLRLDQETVTQLGSGAPIPFDHLQSLSMIMLHQRRKPSYGPFERFGARFVSPMLAATPRLRQLTLGYRDWCSRGGPPLYLPNWSLPLGQLTEFHAPHVWMSSRDGIRIFRECPLVSCAPLAPLDAC